MRATVFTCMTFVTCDNQSPKVRQTLARKAKSGALERIARGVYWVPTSEVTEHHDLTRVCAAIPQAVICLLSALQFHQLTTEWPREIWIAIPRSSAIPATFCLPLRTHRFSQETLEFGVENHTIEGVCVRVTSPEKTIADCFRFRNRYGTDVAVEALKDYLRKPTRRLDLLAQATRICHVDKIIQPYLEALL